MKIKNTQKGFVVQGVIVVIALIVVAGVAYYAGTREDSTKMHGEDTVMVKSEIPENKIEQKSTLTQKPVIQKTNVSYVNDGTKTPVIYSITPSTTNKSNTNFSIRGSYLNGFEGTTLVMIKNQNSSVGYVEAKSNIPDGATKIDFTLPTRVCSVVIGESGRECPVYVTITPGVYKIRVKPWDKESNEITLTITK